MSLDKKMNKILNKYLTYNDINFVKNKRYLQIEKLVQFLKSKNINLYINKDKFFTSKSYLAYSLVLYTNFIKDIEKYTSDKIKFEELENNINSFSQRLNYINNNIVISDYKTNSFIEHSLFDDSLDIVNNTSFIPLKDYIGNISILKYVNPNETIHNHSDDFHMNTIFTDYVNNGKIQNAEILIHESAHIYLNIFLESNNITLDDSRLYLYAPWKLEVKRPERGFLHGVFAFSMVLSFYKELVQNNQDFSFDEIGFIQSYIKHRESQIINVKEDAMNVLKKYPRKLENLILEILKKADGC